MTMQPDIALMFIVALLAVWRIQRERRAHDQRLAKDRTRLYRGQLPEDTE